MINTSDWQGDVHRNRTFWLRREHVDFDNRVEPVAFRLYSCYDVVAAPGWCISAPRQPWSELWLIRSGQVDLSQNENHATVRAGEIALLTGGRSRLSTESRNAQLSLVGFSFSAQLWRAIDLLSLLDAPLRVVPESAVHTRIHNLLVALLEETREKHSLSTLATQGYAQLVFTETLRAIFGDDGLQQRWRDRLPSALSPEIAQTLRWVEIHLDTSLSLEALAKNVHLSPKHFARKFKATLGITPMEHVRRVRHERAQALLAASDSSVGEIAQQCGFDDTAHFSRVFKQLSGLTPLEFRRQSRAFSTDNAHHNPNT
jgi:AraC-like DNA-binding protein